MDDQQFYNPKAVEAVEQGAALFDQIKPGWFNTIDLLRLDISNCLDCAVGQFFEREYCYARVDVLKAIDPVISWESDISRAYRLMEAHGFDASPEYGYDDLTIAWRDLIEKRRANA